MDMEQSLITLESAAATMLSCPGGEAGKEQRLGAEAVFLDFRKVKQGFGLCSYIMGRSRTELVLFETAGLLRLNLISDWETLSPADIKNLYDTIKALVDSMSGFSYAVQRKIASVLAFIVKHESIFIDGGAKRKELVDVLLETAAMKSPETFFVATVVLEALIGEHQFSANTADPSLSYESHFRAKSEFEKYELLKIFQFCLHYWDGFERGKGLEPQIERVFKLLEFIMHWHWTFSKSSLKRKHVAMLEKDTSPVFMPPPSWKDTIMNPEFIPLFFRSYLKVRENLRFASICLSFLLQLSTTQGPMIADNDSKAVFLGRFLPHVTELMELPNKSSTEILGICDLVRKILLYYRSIVLAALEPTMFHHFIKLLGSFTIAIVIEAGVEESKPDIDDRVFRDSSTKILEAWMNILTDSDSARSEVLAPLAKEVFNTYLYCRISPSIGSRIQSPEIEGIDIDEIEEPDGVLFKDQLQTIGLFGRYTPAHSIQLLTELVLYKTSEFQLQVQNIAGLGQCSEIPASLTALYEDIHWVLLIAGHVICLEAQGETNLIPFEINDFSIASNGSPEVSALAVQKALNFEDIPQGNLDPVVKLICAVLRLAALERRIMESSLGFLLSPEMSSNIVWFLNRWASVYFMYSEGNYDKVSPSFTVAFGSGAQSAVLIQSALLRYIHCDLFHFPGEEMVTQEALDLLNSLVNSEKKSHAAYQSPELGPLIEIATTAGGQRGPYKLSNTLYRDLVKNLVSVGSAMTFTSEVRQKYWEALIGPLLSRYQGLISKNPSERHDHEVRVELGALLSAFIGTVMSADSRVSIPIFQMLLGVSTQAGPLLELYSNYSEIVELLLQFVTELAQRCLSYLPHAESFKLHDIAMSVVKAYSTHAQGRRSMEKDAEEGAYQDLVLLIDMLNCLLAKDILDLSPEAFESVSTTAVTACGVCLDGLSAILPLINAQLLQYPNLSNKYYRLITVLAELHPEKVIRVSEWMIQALFESVQIGLHGSVTSDDAFKYCCDFVMYVANQISTKKLQNTPVGQLCKVFLKIFLEMALCQNLGRDLTGSISLPVFALMAAYQDTFQELANQLVNSRTTPVSKAKLEDAFTSLTVGLEFESTGNRRSRKEFTDKFDSFLFTARECL